MGSLASHVNFGCQSLLNSHPGEDSSPSRGTLLSVGLANSADCWFAMSIYSPSTAPSSISRAYG